MDPRLNFLKEPKSKEESTDKSLSESESPRPTSPRIMDSLSSKKSLLGKESKDRSPDIKHLAKKYLSHSPEVSPKPPKAKVPFFSKKKSQPKEEKATMLTFNNNMTLFLDPNTGECASLPPPRAPVPGVFKDNVPAVISRSNKTKATRPSLELVIKEFNAQEGHWDDWDDEHPDMQGFGEPVGNNAMFRPLQPLSPIASEDSESVEATRSRTLSK